MSGKGKGGDSRGNRWKSFKRPASKAPKERDGSQAQSSNTAKDQLKKPVEISPIGAIGDGRLEKKRGSLFDRPKWVAPKTDPAPEISASCEWCGKPIKDISTAIADQQSGNPVHFDCVIDRIVEREKLESGDTVSYIGGGRFGIVHYNNPPDTRDFSIKKIFDWEDKENRSQWRVTMSDHFTVT